MEILYYGAALVVVLGWFGGYIEDGTFLGVLISGIIVGYLVNNGYKNGAVNGLIAGFIGGLILGILTLFLEMTPLLSYAGNEVILLTIIWSLISGVFMAILSTAGGIVGSIIKT